MLRAMPEPPSSVQSRAGHLLIIGGAEDKVRQRQILARFAALAGGNDARVVVISTASSLGDEATELYLSLFRQLGISDVRGMRPLARGDANDTRLIATLKDATGIFLTGGNQLRLTSVIAGTRLARALVTRHKHGAIIAGTSAGASALASHMVAFGTSGATPKQRMTQMSAGLGLLPGVLIDQHFEQRNRIGRLLALVAQSPALLGIGIDEDTAAVVTEEDGAEILRVVGRGVVTLFDGRNVVSNAHEARRTAPLLASGVVMHVLPAGAAFDLTSRTLVRQQPTVDEAAAEELAVANQDLRRLARDIAAGDVSPTVLRRRLARQHHEGDPTHD